MSQKIALVIPCYNEATRLNTDEWLRLAQSHEGLCLWFVDDGSTDDTACVLQSMVERSPDRIRLLSQAKNSGKAEAVRAGLCAAAATRVPLVGYCDADLATPVDEILRLVRAAVSTEAEVVLGSRVRLLGTRISRRAHRHYLGRVFATVASLALQFPVYDTQCGAKIFRNTPNWLRAVSSPFRSRWIFDVELLARLYQGTSETSPVRLDAMLEVPLQQWEDVGGSKISAAAMLRAGAQVMWLLIRLRTGSSAW